MHDLFGCSLPIPSSSILFHHQKGDFSASSVYNRVPQAFASREVQTRDLQRAYLERGSVHVCTQQYTHVYTVVYLRVHFTLLGSSYTLRVSTPRIQMSPPRISVFSRLSTFSVPSRLLNHPTLLTTPSSSPSPTSLSSLTTLHS